MAATPPIVPPTMAPTFFSLLPELFFGLPVADDAALEDDVVGVVEVLGKRNGWLLLSAVASSVSVIVVVIYPSPKVWPAYVKSALAMELAPGDGKHMKSRTRPGYTMVLQNGAEESLQAIGQHLNPTAIEEVGRSEKETTPRTTSL